MSIITIQIASALLITDGDGASILVIYRYALKTKKVGIILSNLAKLLIAFIAICRLIFFINLFVHKLILNNFVSLL